MVRALGVGVVAIAITVGLVGVGPVGATEDTIWVAGRDTGVPTDCERTGTQTQTGVNAHWQRIPDNYQAAAFDTPNYDIEKTAPIGENLAEHTSTKDCAEAILVFLKQIAIEEEAPPNQQTVAGNEAQLLRNALFSGTADFSRPYEVFLSNLYLTGPALASLSATTGLPSATATGLASCEVTDHFFLIECRDDVLGKVILRDSSGMPIVNPSNPSTYLSFNLSGALSQGGGTTYGSMFLLNTDVGQGRSTFGDRELERHEQTHAQQWAQWSWNFGGIYINEWLGDYGDSIWHLWQWGGRGGGQPYAPECFNVYERAANFPRGHYSQCNPNWVDNLPVSVRHPSWP